MRSRGVETSPPHGRDISAEFPRTWRRSCIVITIGKPEAACIREGDDGGGIGVLVGAEVKKHAAPIEGELLMGQKSGQIIQRFHRGNLMHRRIKGSGGGFFDRGFVHAGVEKKKYLELRYQMMPYLYSAVKETCETGVPIIRSLWLHYPTDATAVARGDEYLYGRDILVAPVVDKGATSRSLYLPHGTWYDFWTRERIEGAREITRKVDLETIPLYVRAGAVIPMGPVKQYTEEIIDGPLTLWVHPGADGTFSLYEDDGKTFDYRKHEFMRVNIAWNDKQRRLSMRMAKGSKMLAPMKRNIVVRVAGETVTHEVVFEGSPAEVKL